MSLLNKLLIDKTTQKNIMWATDAYADLGPRYERNEQIQLSLFTGENRGIIKTRARKEFGQQTKRTRQRAEVFTPRWVCNYIYYKNVDCDDDRDCESRIAKYEADYSQGHETAQKLLDIINSGLCVQFYVVDWTCSEDRNKHIFVFETNVIVSDYHKNLLEDRIKKAIIPVRL